MSVWGPTRGMRAGTLGSMNGRQAPVRKLSTEPRARPCSLGWAFWVSPYRKWEPVKTWEQSRCGRSQRSSLSLREATGGQETGEGPPQRGWTQGDFSSAGARGRPAGFSWADSPSFPGESSLCPGTREKEGTLSRQGEADRSSCRCVWPHHDDRGSTKPGQSTPRATLPVRPHGCHAWAHSTSEDSPTCFLLKTELKNLAGQKVFSYRILIYSSFYECSCQI